MKHLYGLADVGTCIAHGRVENQVFGTGLYALSVPRTRDARM